MREPGAVLRRLFPLLLIALLGACAVTPPPESAAPEPETPAAKPEAAAVPAPVPVPVKPPEPRLDVPEAGDIIGWNSTDLNRAFGPASLVRRDLGTEIWQYRTAECVLFLFLYQKPETGQDGGPLKVDHLEVRGNNVGAATCLTSVVRKHVMRTS